MKNNLFKLTNILSIALALLMLVVSLFALKSYWQTTNTNPDIGYSEVKIEFDKKPIEHTSGEETVPDEIEIYTIEIFKKFDLNMDNKKVIDNWVNFYPKDHRMMYLESMESVLNEQNQLFSSDSTSTLDIYEVLNTHQESYKSEYQKLNSEGYEKKLSQFSSLSLAVIGTLMFMIFMMAPVLIQIEKNTRKD